MKIKINVDILKKLNPCKNRLDNYLYFYNFRVFDILEFLDLPNITLDDKMWVCVRVMPRFLVEVFIIDCAVDVYSASVDACITTTTYTYVDDAAAAAAYVAAYAAAYAAAFTGVYDDAYAVAERQRQVERLKYLISNTSKREVKLYEDSRY